MGNNLILKTLIETFAREALGEDALIFYENQTPKNIKGKTWTKLTIEIYNSSPTTLNLPMKSGRGAIDLDVFVPLNRGTKPVVEILDKLSALATECPRLKDDDANVEVLLRNGVTSRDFDVENGYHRTSLSILFRFYRRS